MTLNNMVQDGSAMHEDVSYEMFREAGVPASRVAHVELYLNGEYRGLYLHVETVDDQFLKRHFLDPDGNLYEGTYGGDLTLESISDMDRDELGAIDLESWPRWSSWGVVSRGAVVSGAIQPSVGRHGKSFDESRC
jgi:spore coat protein CotH